MLAVVVWPGLRFANGTLMLPMHRCTAFRETEPLSRQGMRLLPLRLIFLLCATSEDELSEAVRTKLQDIPESD